MPIPDPAVKRKGIMLQGDVPNPIRPPSGCHFYTRCPIARPDCSQRAPVLEEKRPGLWPACHYRGYGRNVISNAGWIGDQHRFPSARTARYRSDPTELNAESQLKVSPRNREKPTTEPTWSTTKFRLASSLPRKCLESAKSCGGRPKVPSIQDNVS